MDGLNPTVLQTVFYLFNQLFVFFVLFQSFHGLIECSQDSIISCLLTISAF